jgi:glycosyltransferase involved in cell wall biosynthesis
MALPAISVIIRSKDEAPRLRLTLASLEAQAGEAELVVVDDGSSDNTQAVLAEAAGRHPRLCTLRHDRPHGRSAASNAGAAIATGHVLLFMDGDTLGAPDLLARHCAAHENASTPIVARGETWHIRSTRRLLDPEAGIPFPEEAVAFAALPAVEHERLIVTRQQIYHAFDDLIDRAEPGVYPGAAPRTLHALEMAALEKQSDCGVLWAAASGSNQSVRRDVFLGAGGFHPGIDINEHRELALRLVRGGAQMRGLAGARSFHLTHRRIWRDPLRDTAWEAAFLAAHPQPAVALLALFWASLARHSALADGPRIDTFSALETASHTPDAPAFDAARRRLGLPALGRAFWESA